MQNDAREGSEGCETPEFRSSYGGGNPTQNVAKYQKEDIVTLNLGRPRGAFDVKIVEVRKHKGLYQYQVEQDGVLYNEGEWVDQKKLKEQ